MRCGLLISSSTQTSVYDMALGPPAPSAVLSPRPGGVSSVATRLIVAQFVFTPCQHLLLSTVLNMGYYQTALCTGSHGFRGLSSTVSLRARARHMPLSDSFLAQLSLHFGHPLPFLTPSVPTLHFTVLLMSFAPHTFKSNFTLSPVLDLSFDLHQLLGNNNKYFSLIFLFFFYFFF